MLTTTTSPCRAVTRRVQLVEMNSKNKTGVFVDKRFGEYDTSMTAEERMLQRFQHERVKRHERSGAFNLPDTEEGEEEGDSLTHGGQSLGQMLDGALCPH
jgi:nucleolar protein 14